MIGATRLGRISRNMIRAWEAPTDREASTNSFSRSESVWPRMIRAISVQVVAAITKITTAIPGLMRPPKHPSPSDQDRDPRAVDRAAEHVAPQVVDAEPMLGARTGGRSEDVERLTVLEVRIG